jgi:hypothetical protein
MVNVYNFLRPWHFNYKTTGIHYRYRHVLSTSPPFMLWWSNLEILFAPQAPPPPQLSLHRRAALLSNSNGTRSGYSRENPKSSLYCDIPVSMVPTFTIQYLPEPALGPIGYSVHPLFFKTPILNFPSVFVMSTWTLVLFHLWYLLFMAGMPRSSSRRIWTGNLC